MENNYDYNEIESYLKQKLAGDNLRQFTDRLAKDTDFAAEVDLHRKVLETIEAVGVDHFSSSVQSVQEALNKEGFFINENDIDTYVQSTADDALKAKIEYRKANDPTFAKELTLHQEVLSAIDETGAEESFMKNLKEIKTERSAPTKQEPAKTFSLRRFIAPLSIAASVLLMIGFFTFQFAQSNYSNQALIGKNSSKYEMPIVRSTEGTKGQLASAIKTYNEEEYLESIQLLAQIKPDSDLYQEAQFYSGLAHFQLDNFKQALPYFENVAQSNDIRFTEKADWYQLITYLSIEDTGSKFQSLLKEISEDQNHSYQKQAIDLKVKLNSFWRKFN